MTAANLVLPGFHPDPTMCRVGEAFYLATTDTSGIGNFVMTADDPADSCRAVRLRARRRGLNVRSTAVAPVR